MLDDIDDVRNEDGTVLVRHVGCKKVCSVVSKTYKLWRLRDDVKCTNEVILCVSRGRCNTNSCNNRRVAKRALDRPVT